MWNITFNCGNGTENIQAEGIAVVEQDGSLGDIKILEQGKGYKTMPNVNIVGGGGRGAKVKAVVDDTTSVHHIEILDGGHGYISTPQVIIEPPRQNKKCRLYLKK